MKGIGVSPGMAIGRALRVVRQKVAATGVLLSGKEAVQAEVERYRQAVKGSVKEIRTLITAQAGAAADILETHIEMLTDPQLDNDILEHIQAQKNNASDAVHKVTTLLAATFRNMEDPYLSARATDIEDIGQ